MHDSQDTYSGVEDVLAQLRGKGVKLWLEKGEIRYRAPKGAVSPCDIEKLRASRDQLIAVVKQANESPERLPRLEPRRDGDPVPLTYSQIAHWDWYHLGERPNLRQISCAIRLEGCLDTGAFRDSIAAVVRRHESLRTRIVVHDGIRMQEVYESSGQEVHIENLRAHPRSNREREIRSIIERHVLEPVNVTVGPLLSVKLLVFGDREHVLVLALEHLISDVFSMNLLVRDIFLAYVHIVRKRPLTFPTMPIQFPDFAVWQSKSEKYWAAQHGAYWAKRLTGCQRVRFPSDRDSLDGSRRGWGTAPVRIGRELTSELRALCRDRRTTLTMSVFAAYAAAVLLWCNVDDVVIQYATDGRGISPRIENTIGFFAAHLFLRMELREDDRFDDLLTRAREEHGKAYEHADSAYIEAEFPRREVVRNASFNWLPRGSSSWVSQGSRIDLSDLDSTDQAITCSPVSYEHPILGILDWDKEPFVVLHETDDEIVGGVHFASSRFSSEMMERFAQSFVSFVATMARRPETRVRDASVR